MKKLKYLLLFIATLFIFNITAFANEVDYSIKGYYVDSNIDVAGSLHVKEIIVMKGSFNGYERDIRIKSHGTWHDGDPINFEQSAIYNGFSLTDLKISGGKIDRDENNFDLIANNDFDKFENVSVASVGNKGVYTVSDNGSVAKNIRMYNPNSSGLYAFMLEYTITNVVVLHNDVAEFYYNYIGTEFSDTLQNVEVRVRLPHADTSKDFRFWAHGELTGESHAYVNENDENIGVIATASKIRASKAMDIRMTFDKDIISVQEFLNHSGVDATDEILKVEKKRADDANRRRFIARVANIFLFLIDIFYIITLFFLTIYLFFKLDKEYKADFDQEYYRDFLDHYQPEELNYLMNHMIDNNAFSASFLNLIYKHKIEIIPTADEKDTAFKIVSREGLTTPESMLVNLLFDKVGDGDAFTLKLLKKYTKSSSKAQTFASKFASWKRVVLSEAKKKNIYEKYSGIRTLCILLAIFGLMINFFAFILEMQLILTVVCGIFGVIFIIYASSFTRRTREANEDYAKAKASKRFLNDFGSFKGKDIPEVKLWDKYLVYATAFGIANKVEKNMTKLLKDQEISSLDTTYLRTNQLLFVNNSLNMNHAIQSSISSSIASAVSSAVASSVASSSSGSGGGFSSGGGGGGGGGGGHGF